MRKQEEKQKEIIFYARDYRHFTATKGNTVLFAVCCVLPVVLLFILGYPVITRGISIWAGRIIAGVTGETVDVFSAPFLPWQDGVYYISMRGTVPTFTHALVAGLLSLAAIPVVCQAAPNSRPMMIYFVMALYVQLFSCLFFIFWPDRFPYTLTDYSQLYITQMAALLIILPAIFGIALSLMNASVILRITAMVIQVFVQLFYNTVRYLAYLIFIYYCTSLYMATLFFTLGVLFDFIQMVTIYGIFAKKVSEQYDSPEGRLKWVWS